jgi:hypothetical protein
MTWQRIDENTYIDDSLVTCAEYQLFIDEMRTLEQYHQPDHWISYQFPVGQAREPILGVRQSDAVSFCTWLTARESKRWKFRLPTQDDVKDYPLNLLEQTPLGYWILGEIQFAWVGSVPNDARILDPANARDLAVTQYLGGNLNISPAIYRARTRALDLDRAPTFEIDNLLALGLDRTLDLSRARALELDHMLAYARTLTNSRAFALYDLCIDVFTLRERIAERSPAFEGIRLVKERMR